MNTEKLVLAPSDARELLELGEDDEDILNEVLTCNERAL
jgi:hypothetical protein